MLQTKLLGRYVLEEELGQGGMGRVYQGRDALLDRAVAVKVLSPTGLGEETRRRLLVEAKAAARLNHPNVVTVYDAGEDAGVAFLVMELINGRSLDAVGQLPFDKLMTVAMDICRALEHAHDHDIIHRDLKPQNIFLTQAEQVKLMDFGLARIEDGSRLTREGTILGTFAYMAPELLRGQPATMQSDLYSLGVILFEGATGHVPFAADNLAAVLQRVLNTPAPSPSSIVGTLPPQFDDLVQRLLAKEPGERLRTAREVFRKLRTMRDNLGDSLTPSLASRAEDKELQIKLLGGFGLVFRERMITSVSRPRLQELLAFLLLHRDTTLSRSQLAYRFWPESTDKQARTNLRKALHLLRDNMPEFDTYVTVAANHVRWRDEQSYALDVEEYLSALASAEGAAAAAEERRYLEVALSLYTGPLLPDCYADWIVPHREQLDALHRKARLRLVKLLEAAGEGNRAVQVAQSLVHENPLDEESCRLLMRVHLANGEPTLALQCYQDLAANLEQEVGAAPAPATRRLYMQIRADTLPATPPASAFQPGERPLIGRKQEWSVLKRAWQSGTSLFVSIQGEAGIGKTHLAEAFLSSAAREGMKTAAAHCYEGGELAFEPVISWLRTPRSRADLALLDDGTRKEVGRLLPELAYGTEQFDKNGPIAESWQRQRLFAALGRALLTGDEPVLLLLDDVQWSDMETLEWLQYLLRKREGPPVVVLGTLRTEALATDDPVIRMKRRLQRQDRLIEIELTRLDKGESGELAQSVLGDDIASESLEALYTETEGSPLLIVESMRAAQAGPRAAPPAIDPMTPKVQAVIKSRLARLSPDAQALAAVASVIGRAFTLDVLVAAAADSGERMVAALDELCKHEIVAERRGAAEDEYAFTHNKLQQVTYEGLTSARQRLLHGRVADALEKSYHSPQESSSAQIGRHFEKARLFPRALTYYQRAAEQASRLYAYRDAERLYARAIAMAIRLNQPGEQLTELHQQRGRMLEHAGNFAAAIEVYRELERLGRSRWDRRMECVALTHLVDCYVKPDTGHSRLEAKPLIERGLRLAREIGAPEQEAHLLWSRMVQATHYGHTDEAQAAGEACAAICRRHGLTRRLALTLHDLALNLRLNGEYDLGNQYGEESRALFREMDNLPLLADSLNQQALFDTLQHNLEEALQRAAEAATISRQIANNWNLAYARWIEGMVYAARGAWDKAISSYEQSMRTGTETGFLMAKTAIPLQLSLLYGELGSYADARRLQQVALETGRETAAFILEAANAALAVTAFQSADTVGGLRWLRETSSAQSLGDIARALLLTVPVRAVIAAAGHGNGSPGWQEALRHVEAALAEARKRQLHLHELTLRHYRGIVLQELGQVETAVHCWQETLETARRLELRPLSLEVAGALHLSFLAGEESDTAAQYEQLARETLAAIASQLADSQQRSYYVQTMERRFRLL